MSCRCFSVFYLPANKVVCWHTLGFNKFIWKHALYECSINAIIFHVRILHHNFHSWANVCFAFSFDTTTYKTTQKTYHYDVETYRTCKTCSVVLLSFCACVFFFFLFCYRSWHTNVLQAPQPVVRGWTALLECRLKLDSFQREFVLFF